MAELAKIGVAGCFSLSTAYGSSGICTGARRLLSAALASRNAWEIASIADGVGVERSSDCTSLVVVAGGDGRVGEGEAWRRSLLDAKPARCCGMGLGRINAGRRCNINMFVDGGWGSPLENVQVEVKPQWHMRHCGSYFQQLSLPCIHRNLTTDRQKSSFWVECYVA